MDFDIPLGGGGNQSCPLGLEVLDFTPNSYPCINQSDKWECEIEWPCEIRLFWRKIHPFVTFTRGFLSWGSLGIIVLGVFLNTVSLWVLLASGLARKGSGVYLVALAICDSGNLLANILIGVVRGMSAEFNEFFMVHEWLCRFHGVFVELFQTISAWIVVAFTVERSLAVWYPMLFRQRRNKRAKLVVGSLTIVSTLFCLSKLFLTGFEKDSVFGYVPCNSQRFIWEGMAYVRVAFQTWIPTVIVFCFNCLMFWKLRKIKIERKQLTEHIRNYGVHPNANGRNRAERKRSFISRPSPTNPMLVAVSLAYLVLVFPLGLVQTIELHWSLHHTVPTAFKEPEKSAYVNWIICKLLLKHIRSFFFAFYQLNFAINFFLYFAAGVEFRRYLQCRIRLCSIRFRRGMCLCHPVGEESQCHQQCAVSNSNASNTTSMTTLPSSSVPSSLIYRDREREETL